MDRLCGAVSATRIRERVHPQPPQRLSSPRVRDALVATACASVIDCGGPCARDPLGWAPVGSDPVEDAEAAKAYVWLRCVYGRHLPPPTHSNAQLERIAARALEPLTPAAAARAAALATAIGYANPLADPRVCARLGVSDSSATL